MQLRNGGKAAMIPDANTLTPKNGHADHEIQRPSEAQLLAAAKRGKSGAFEVLCEAHTAKLFKAALYITRNREDAEDAVQDSLMRAFMHIKNFQGNSSFSTWLMRIAINSALMIRRKGRKAHEVSTDEPCPSDEPRTHLQIPDASPNPEETYVARERRRILHKSISRLRPRIRAVIEIGQLQELSIKETAKVLDISIAAAKGRFFHARAALRRSAALRAIAAERTEPAA